MTKSLFRDINTLVVYHVVGQWQQRTSVPRTSANLFEIFKLVHGFPVYLYIDETMPVHCLKTNSFIKNHFNPLCIGRLGSFSNDLICVKTLGSNSCFWQKVFHTFALIYFSAKKSEEKKATLKVQSSIHFLQYSLLFGIPFLTKQWMERTFGQILKIHAAQNVKKIRSTNLRGPK